MNIQTIKAWPPGAFMMFDNRAAVERARKEDLSMPDVRTHVGVGVVLANDGAGTIWVLWDSGCRDMFTEYNVKTLNPNVISRIG